MSKIPHPSTQEAWPSWFYPPHATDENAGQVGAVFHKAEDVPDGWAVDWRLHEPAPPAPLTPEPKPLGRDELRAELTRRDIAFVPTATKAVLQAQLDAALVEEALENEV